jgi:hypothetical protein
MGEGTGGNSPHHFEKFRWQNQFYKPPAQKINKSNNYKEYIFYTFFIKM